MGLCLCKGCLVANFINDYLINYRGFNYKKIDGHLKIKIIFFPYKYDLFQRATNNKYYDLMNAILPHIDINKVESDLDTLTCLFTKNKKLIDYAINKMITFNYILILNPYYINDHFQLFKYCITRSVKFYDHTNTYDNIKSYYHKIFMSIFPSEIIDLILSYIFNETDYVSMIYNRIGNLSLGTI